MKQHWIHRVLHRTTAWVMLGLVALGLPQGVRAEDVLSMPAVWQWKGWGSTQNYFTGRMTNYDAAFDAACAGYGALNAWQHLGFYSKPAEPNPYLNNTGYNPSATCKLYDPVAKKYYSKSVNINNAQAYFCPDSSWTLSGATCTRPPCPVGQEYIEGGVCAPKCGDNEVRTGTTCGCIPDYVRALGVCTLKHWAVTQGAGIGMTGTWSDLSNTYCPQVSGGWQIAPTAQAAPATLTCLVPDGSGGYATVSANVTLGDVPLVPNTCPQIVPPSNVGTGAGKYYMVVPHPGRAGC